MKPGGTFMVENVITAPTMALVLLLLAYQLLA